MLAHACRVCFTNIQFLLILCHLNNQPPMLAHACRVCFTNIQFLLILCHLNNQPPHAGARVSRVLYKYSISINPCHLNNQPHSNTANAKLQRQNLQVSDWYECIQLSVQLLLDSTIQQVYCYVAKTT
jgi:hypothetical protein